MLYLVNAFKIHIKGRSHLRDFMIKLKITPIFILN